MLALEDDDTFISSTTDLAIEMQKKLAQKLSEVVFSEDLFLEMFEEEYYLIEVIPFYMINSIDYYSAKCRTTGAFGVKRGTLFATERYTFKQAAVEPASSMWK